MNHLLQIMGPPVFVESPLLAIVYLDRIAGFDIRPGEATRRPESRSKAFIMSVSLNLNKESSHVLLFGLKISVIQGSALQPELNCKYIFKVVTIVENLEQEVVDLFGICKNIR